MLWWTLRQLKSVDADVRRQAAQELAKSKDRRAVEPLLVALADEDSSTRTAARNALAQIDPNWKQSQPAQKAAAAFVSLLQRGEAAQRERAAQALAAIGSDATVEPLIEALSDRELAVQKAAAGGLGETPHPRSMEALLAALKDADREVRPVVARALGKLGGAPAIEALTGVLENQERYVAEAAAEALAAIGDPEAVRPLVLLLTHREQESRVAARRALDKLSPNWAQLPVVQLCIGSLVQQLKDPDSGIRSLTSPVLGEILDHVDPAWGRSEAAKAAVADLFECLTRWSSATAARALGEIGDRRAIGPLVLALAHWDEELRHTAERVLRKIDKDWARSPEASAAAAELIEQLVSTGRGEEALEKIRPDWPSSSEARDALPKVALQVTSSGRGQELFARIFTQWSESDTAATALTHLVAALAGPDTKVREAAQKLLTRVEPDWAGSRSASMAIPALIRQIGYPDLGASNAAREVLRRIDPDWTRREESRAAIPELLKSLWLPDRTEQDEADVEAQLKEIDPEWPRSAQARQAIPDLVESLVYNAKLEQVLAKIDPEWPQSEEAKAAVPKLMEAGGDRYLPTKNAALKILRRIDPTLSAKLSEEPGIRCFHHFTMHAVREPVPCAGCGQMISGSGEEGFARICQKCGKIVHAGCGDKI